MTAPCNAPNGCTIGVAPQKPSFWPDSGPDLGAAHRAQNHVAPSAIEPPTVSDLRLSAIAVIVEAPAATVARGTWGVAG